MKIISIDTDLEPIRNSYVSGTSLQGHFTASYDELVQVFGEPKKYEETGGYDKVWTEWVVEFETEDEDGDTEYVTATIYDWKENGPYDSRSGQYRWHIGGRDWKAEDAVGTYFNQELNKEAA